MNTLIIGNLISLIGCTLMIAVGFIKEKKKILYVQTVQVGFFLLANIVLGGITGGLVSPLFYNNPRPYYNNNYYYPPYPRPYPPYRPY